MLYIDKNSTLLPVGNVAAFYYASASTPTDPAMSPISQNLDEALRNLIVNAQVSGLYSLGCNHSLTKYGTNINLSVFGKLITRVLAHARQVNFISCVRLK